MESFRLKLATDLAKPALTSATNKIDQEARLILEFGDSFRRLQRRLDYLSFYIKDADRNGGRQQSSRSNEELVRDLESAALEAQDVIDLCVVKGLAPIASSSRPWAWASCFNDLLAACFGIPATYEIDVQIKKMEKILDEIEKRASFTTLSRHRASTNSISSNSEDLLETAEVIYPEDSDVDVIAKRRDIEGLIDQYRVVAVVGMGGSGKTHLLHRVFESIKSRYEVSIWLSVSRTFTVTKLQLNVLEAFEVGKFELQGESADIVQGKIYNALKNRKYLIVFDDVWELQGNEQAYCPNVMEKLRLVGLPEHDLRTVLVSTRDHEVASHVGACVYKMQLLSYEHSKELFFKHLLLHSQVEQLQLDGNVEANAAIDTALKRCGGLPLAIIAVAGLLKHQKHQNLDEWAKSVQYLSSSFSSTDSQMNVLTISLMLSFNDLDYRIKPCFITLGLFAEGEKIDAKNLIGMWLANSHVRSHEEGIHMLKHLCNRCLLELKTYAGSVEIEITIHDLVYDLAVKLCREDGGICEVSHYREDKWQELLSRNKRISRISLSNAGISCIPKTVTFPRSLRVLRLNENENLSEIPLKSLAPAVVLRTLDIKGTNIASLPACIGNFLLLTYLDIRYCPIERFPECLRNLKLLKCLYTSIKHDVPQWIGDLEQLTLLEAESAQWTWTKIDRIPKYLNCLKGVRTHVGSHDDDDDDSHDDDDDSHDDDNNEERQGEGVWIVGGRIRSWDSFSEEGPRLWLPDESPRRRRRRRRLWKSLSKLTQLEFLDHLVIYKFEEGCIPPPNNNIVHLTLHRGHHCQALTLPNEWHHHCQPLTLPNEWQCRVQRLQYLTMTGIRFPNALHGFQNLSGLCLFQSGGVYSKVISDLPGLQTLRLIDDGTCEFLPKEYERSEAFPKLRALFISGFLKLKKMPTIKHGAMRCLSELDLLNCPELSEGCGWTQKVKTLSRLSLDSINEEFKAELEAAYNSVGEDRAKQSWRRLTIPSEKSPIPSEKSPIPSEKIEESPTPSEKIEEVNKHRKFFIKVHHQYIL